MDNNYYNNMNQNQNQSTQNNQNGYNPYNSNSQGQTYQNTPSGIREVRNRTPYTAGNR